MRKIYDMIDLYCVQEYSDAEVSDQPLATGDETVLIRMRQQK